MGFREWVQGRRGSAPPKPVPAQTRPRPVDARWVSGGETVEVAGFTVPGLVYAGHGLPAVGDRSGPEPALLDGSLPVDADRPDWDGKAMGYWPAYGQIPPECRAAYLTWQAGERPAGTAVGYVFLFLFGLERRALVDGADRDVVGGEVVRLLSLYDDHRSFRRYATAFVDLLDGLGASDASRRAPPSPLTGRRDLPARLKIGLGELAADGRPVDPTWALAWVRAHPQVRLRTPVRRCPEQFDALFTQRYAARYGDGLILRPNETALTLSYQPASGSFDAPVVHTLDALPDVTTPPGEVVDLVEACTRDLDRYSRWLRRHPDEADSPAARARLPRELRTGPRGPVVLDPARIRARTAESDEVASLLAAVFADEAPVSAGTVGTPEPAGLLGLDAPHAAFLESLLAKPSWTQGEVAAEASAAGVLPAGALDTINEAALDAYGESLCKPTDDGLELNPDVFEELTR